MPPPQPNGLDPAADLTEVGRWVTTHCRPGAGELLRAGMETVEILRSLGMDQQGLLVGLLQSLNPVSHNEQALIAGRFGQATTALMAGVRRMQQLTLLSQNSGRSTNPEVHEENLRKMLIAMVDDVRVVLIELAHQLQRLRACRQEDREMQQEAGRMTLDVYAPLANRLGVWQLKWEMEDYALRYLEPGDYRKLAAKLDEKRVTREKYIAEYITALKTALLKSDIECEVYGRPKHIYSIWKKMKFKGVLFENLWDIRAVRILVDSVADCYSALGTVHTNWRHMPGEFDDYIATPKNNGYRSIHTVIIGPQDKTVEVQIRTREMHQENELGIAAHWRYKENIRQDDSIDNKVLWLRQLLEWKEELLGSTTLVENFRRNIEQQRVYVFTPKGSVIDLPHGSTPIDFAYAIHTEVGHCTRGARVNGKMVPLEYELATGDQVEIQTVKNGHPSRDWLRNDLGYIRTNRARSRISQWFKHMDYDQYLAEGRSMLERELSRLGVDDLSYDKIAQQTHFRKTDDMLAALGANDFKLAKALAPFRRSIEHSEQEKPCKPRRSHRHRHPDKFSVSGVGNLLTHMANCCDPVPGDPIVGFITAGRGVTIHRQNCNNMANLDDHRRNRLVEVEWGKSDLASYPVEIRISAYHRSGLLNDITQFLKDDKTEVLMLNMETDDEQLANIRLRLEISGLKKLSRILHRLSRIPNVLEVRRVTA